MVWLGLVFLPGLEVGLLQSPELALEVIVCLLKTIVFELEISVCELEILVLLLNGYWHLYTLPEVLHMYRLGFVMLWGVQARVGC